RVYCSNHQKGANVVKVCKTSCIACGMCVKACENEAITLENNVAVINPDKCINCGKCKTVCKRNAII
ncbi:MAG: 4Fe-4S binding protein, partial [Acutalibacteraceae bacterium]|nr:4Fe-4S binding protein [Acutalibacteraceae bacterium]